MTILGLLDFFLTTKSNAFNSFKKFAKAIQNEKNLKIIFLRNDHGGEFQNEQFENFCEELGITHNVSSPRTSQQNRVVKRKNRSLEELARTMLNEPSKIFLGRCSFNCLLCV